MNVFSATNADGDGLYYFGSLVYRRQNGGDLTLESVAFNGGRFVATASGIEPHYFVTDHLGSVRVIVDSEGTVLERNNYYPFGKRWNEPESILSDNRYRYNGKEEQAFAGVPYTDYGARMSDPYTGRWNGVDPLSEKYFSVTPYAFCGNNPISFMDPDGKDRRIVVDRKNKTMTVQATYYHDINSGSYVKSGIDIFNNMSDLTYTDNEGNTFDVKFELKGSRSFNPYNDAMNDPSGNYVTIVNDLGSKDGGKVLGKGGGKNVFLLQESDAFVSAHEMGHTLGAAMQVDGNDNHASEGLMVKSVDHPKKSNKLDQKSVNEIIESGRGPVEEKKPTFWEKVKNWFMQKE